MYQHPVEVERGGAQAIGAQDIAFTDGKASRPPF